METCIDISGVTLETPRLILRPWKESDLPDFHEYARVDGVGQMAGWPPHRSLEESRKILTMFMAEKRVFAVVLRESGKVIGSLGIEPPTADLPANMTIRKSREIGYVLARDYWGRGLMPEAVMASINYCFSQLTCDFLTCCHFAWNHQSRRVIEKCGFRFFREETRKTALGTTENALLYVLNNPDK